MSIHVLVLAFILQPEPERSHGSEDSFGLDTELPHSGGGQQSPAPLRSLNQFCSCPNLHCPSMSPLFPAPTLLLTSAVTHNAKDSLSMLGLVLALSKSPRKEKEECCEDNRGHVPSCVRHTPHGRFLREE